MANSLKVSDLQNIDSISNKDMFLLASANNENSTLSSYNLTYETLYSDIYSRIMSVIESKFNKLSNDLSTAIQEKVGNTDISAISCNTDGIVTNYPDGLVGLSAIHDLCNIISRIDLNPYWQ